MLYFRSVCFQINFYKFYKLSHFWVIVKPPTTDPPHRPPTRQLIGMTRSNSTKLTRTFISQFLRDYKMGLLKIYNSGNYAHAQDSNAYNFCWSSKTTKLTRTFISQLLRGYNMGLLKIYNSGNYAHAQVSGVYNFCSSSDSTKLGIVLIFEVHNE